MEKSNAVTAQPLSEVALPAGTNLLDGQFTITSPLSAGGFGITYRAKDNFLGRTVVLKECFSEDFCLRSGKTVIARNQSSEKNFNSIVEMFIREARSLAKLRHPNIVGVHRAFEENGTAYMALDLIVGQDLDAVLSVNRATLPPSGVKDMLLRLLDAIETVHDQDLLHRDISPDNIMIEKDGNPVLIDFGAARGDASRRTRAISSLLVVKDGYSPQEFYMAGSIQTPSSDLYALAATFYHVLSGEPPPDSQIRTVEIAGQNPDPCIPLAGRIEGYEPAFLEAIDKAMQPLPRDRLQSAGEWLDMILDEPAEAARDDVAQSQTAANLALSLSQLVEETNEEVRKTRLIVAEPQPAPETPRQVAATPDWLDEFNKDSVSSDYDLNVEEDEAEEEDLYAFDDFDDLSAEDDEIAVTAPVRVPAQSIPVQTKPDSDWINRVREKQTRAIQVEQPAPQSMFSQMTRPTSLGLAQEGDDGGQVKSDQPPQMSEMIVPLLKYLSTGVAMGLGLMLIYMNI